MMVYLGCVWSVWGESFWGEKKIELAVSKKVEKQNFEKILTDGSKTETGIRIVDSITWDGYDKSNGSTGNVIIVNLKKKCVNPLFHNNKNDVTYRNDACKKFEMWKIKEIQRESYLKEFKIYVALLLKTLLGMWWKFYL